MEVRRLGDGTEARGVSDSTEAPFDKQCDREQLPMTTHRISTYLPIRAGADRAPLPAPKSPEFHWVHF
jgi:hypothetical protein